MVWNGRVTAKELLGMEANELKQKLDTAASKEDLTGINEKVDGLNNSLASIQASLAKLTAPPEIKDPNAEADLNDPTTQMLTDPAGFVRRTTEGISNTASSARADVLEMRARQKYPQVFAQFNDAIMAGANKFALNQRAQDGFWDYHVATFTGQKVLAGEMPTGGYPSLMGAGSGVATLTGPDDPNKGFDPEVAAFLKSRNVPLDKAAIVKKQLDNGEPVDISTYKRSA